MKRSPHASTHPRHLGLYSCDVYTVEIQPEAHIFHAHPLLSFQPPLPSHLLPPLIPPPSSSLLRLLPSSGLNIFFLTVAATPQKPRACPMFESSQPGMCSACPQVCMCVCVRERVCVCSACRHHARRHPVHATLQREYIE